jgi:hypothetical protein
MVSDCEYEANEISLTISNDYTTYKRAIRPTILNLARKKIQGTYKKNLALKAWLNVINFSINQMYNKNAVKPSAEIRKLAALFLSEEWSSELHYTYDEMRRLKKSGKPWSLRR